METGQKRFEKAIALFDRANAADPRREPVDGREVPSELLYAQRLSEMLARFAPSASEALRLAARCQHIERWRIPRSDFPMTQAGYKAWRSKLQKFHAGTAARLLREAGYDEATIGRVESLLRKERLKLDAEVQALEDAVDLLFLESYLEAFVAKHPDYDEAKWIDILKKTLFKMSLRGRAAALTMIRLPEALAPLVRRAAELGDAMDPATRPHPD